MWELRLGDKQGQSRIHGTPEATVRQGGLVKEVGAHQWCLALDLGQRLAGRNACEALQLNANVR